MDRKYEAAIEVWKDDSMLIMGVGQGPYNFSTLRERVTLPTLDSIEILGAGNVTLSGFAQHELAVKIVGTGRVGGESLWIDELDLKVLGTGGVDFGNIGPLLYADVGLNGVNKSTLNMADGSTISGVLVGITRLNYWGSRRAPRLDENRFLADQVAGRVSRHPGSVANRVRPFRLMVCQRAKRSWILHRNRYQGRRNTPGGGVLVYL